MNYYFLGTTEDDALTYALKNPATANYYNNGSFAFYTTYNVNASGSGWSIMAYDVFLDAEGFIRTDYTLTLDAGQSQFGQLPVEFNAGADVASVKYAAFEGAASVFAAAKSNNVFFNLGEQSYASFVATPSHMRCEKNIWKMLITVKILYIVLFIALKI